MYGKEFYIPVDACWMALYFFGISWKNSYVSEISFPASQELIIMKYIPHVLSRFLSLFCTHCTSCQWELLCEGPPSNWTKFLEFEQNQTTGKQKPIKHAVIVFITLSE